MFIRFVINSEKKEPLRCVGIITTAAEMFYDGKLHSDHEYWLKDAYDWLTTNLPVPPFEKKVKSKEWDENCICWFKDTTRDAINKTRQLAEILKLYNFKIKSITTQNPGKILYEDDYQVVAKIPNCIKIKHISNV